MKDPSEPMPKLVKLPDQVAHSENALDVGQGRKMPADEVVNETKTPDFKIDIVNDERAGIYNATAGDRELGGITYALVGNRMELLAASVFPKFRHQGVATELIRRVLDDVRAQDKTVTILCPIVNTFLENNPAYVDLVDLDHPGLGKVAHR